MKKYLVGILVAFVFIIYSLDLRHQHSKPIIVPTNLAESSDSTPSGKPTTTTPELSYKDGSYTGSAANAFYGNIQVAVTISSGKITDVNFLQTPDENPNSIFVNQQATPYLAKEAVQAQNSHVSIVTGATFTSEAFIQSLSNALSQAKQ